MEERTVTISWHAVAKYVRKETEEYTYIPVEKEIKTEGQIIWDWSMTEEMERLFFPNNAVEYFVF